MATAELSNRDSFGAHAASSAIRHDADPLATIWAAFASLRLTVVLLSLLTVLVFFGTLAQASHDVWYVVREGYFRVWFAWIEFQTLPALLSVFKPNKIELPGGFYFPGGYLIGAVMAVNLIAAHSMRYNVLARGARLSSALALLALGIAATWWVITYALSSPEAASVSPVFAERLWLLLRALFAGVALGLAYVLTLAWSHLRKPEWFALAAFDAVLLAAAAYLFAVPEWRINDAGMRIVWQLLQATAAGALLMASAWLLFGKRSGVVLLHIGIALFMAHEFYVGETNVEANMAIEEGETVNYAMDIRQSELAIIDRSDDETDRVTVIPDAMLMQAAAAPSGSAGRVISHPDLPVDVRIVDYFANSSIKPAEPSDDNKATLGAGQQIVAVELPNVSGVGSASDFPSAYVELLDKESGESLGTVMVTNLFDPYILSRSPRLVRMPGVPVEALGEQTVEFEDTPLAVALRFERVYKPYDVTLLDFEHEKYMGTGMAKSYASVIKLVDHEVDTELMAKTWMNNPLRYRGETFYQSGFNEVTGTGTVLQVVKNESWMLPYIACALVAVGMLVHFGQTLLRFLNRRLRELRQLQDENPTSTAVWYLRPEIIIPGIAALLAAGYLGSKFRVEEVVVDDMSVSDFATVPVLDEGRVKPIDTVARNLLQAMSSRQEAVIDVETEEKIPATQWLLDFVARKPDAMEAYIFRITNLEVIDTLSLDRRPGFYRYSFNEIDENIETLHEEVLATKDVEDEELTRFQRDVRQLWEQRRICIDLANSFDMVRFRGPETVLVDLATAAERALVMNAPEPIPPATADGHWLTLYESDLRDHCFKLKQEMGATLANTPPVVQSVVDRFGDHPVNDAYMQLAQVLESYRSGDARQYDTSLEEVYQAADEYEEQLNDSANAEFVGSLKTVEKLNMDRVRFEYLFNSTSPFYYCMVLYLIAMVLAAGAWLVWPQVLGRSAIAIIVVTLIVHTLAIAARMYISDRPPITNLYTTAICIGWAVVLFMLVLESIFKLGIGGFVAGAVGFATLLIAHNLGLDEDTFTVMQAVLDTQFWLATHVITINLGYATTMLAGCLGIVYVIAVHLLNLFDEKQTKQLAAMMYGSLCFAILFSFVGTVLGGLWADDSWGRFWGWDPKENGALMIVLWNAVALHARWGKMVGARGLALLTIVGNVVTAWSWFGVNQLGQGLHNYGFSDGLAANLFWFVVSQAVVLVVGLIPWHDTPAKGAKVG